MRIRHHNESKDLMLVLVMCLILMSYSMSASVVRAYYGMHEERDLIESIAQDLSDWLRMLGVDWRQAEEITFRCLDIAFKLSPMTIVSVLIAAMYVYFSRNWATELEDMFPRALTRHHEEGPEMHEHTAVENPPLNEFEALLNHHGIVDTPPDYFLDVVTKSVMYEPHILLTGSPSTITRAVDVRTVEWLLTSPDSDKQDPSNRATIIGSVYCSHLQEAIRDWVNGKIGKAQSECVPFLAAERVFNEWEMELLRVCDRHTLKVPVYYLDKYTGGLMMQPVVLLTKDANVVDITTAERFKKTKNPSLDYAPCRNLQDAIEDWVKQQKANQKNKVPTREELKNTQLFFNERMRQPMRVLPAAPQKGPYNGKLI